MKFIRELVEVVSPLLEEDAAGKKTLYLEGVYLQGNIKNRNGRVYPTEILENEVKRYTINYIDKNRAYGELGHPNSPTINLDRQSHRIISLKKEGNNFIGRAKVSSSPNGLIVRCIVEEGGQLGMSSRGLGSLKETSNGMEVQEDFYLSTAGDIVSDPSAPEAFVNGIMENVEWVWDDGILKSHQIDVMESGKKKIRSVSKSKIQEAKLELFSRFIKTL